LPALALPAIALGSTEPDPIFAVISAHRAAFMQKMVACRVTIYADDDTPEQEAAYTSEGAARDAYVELKSISLRPSPPQ
jgi:hypothetical protein